MQFNILAYVGPETVLPVASVFAAITGALMMFGKGVWRFLVELFTNIRKRF